jgi:uncharacterized protein YbjQ (UPF0145 family)
MLITTTENIAGKQYEVIGLVKGGTVRSKHIGKDILAGLKTIVGGEIPQYTEMMNESRALATKRMVDEAKQLGADAVVMMRYSTCSIMANASETVAYGTAVKFI